MMKAHLKRSWVQYMSVWMEEHGLEWGGRSHDEILKQSVDCRDISAVFLQYPVLDAASSVTSVHLQLKVSISFHTISYYFILFHTISYCFILFYIFFQACGAYGQGIQRLNINLLKPEKIAIAARGYNMSEECCCSCWLGSLPTTAPVPTQAFEILTSFSGYISCRKPCRGTKLARASSNQTTTELLQRQYRPAVEHWDAQ